MFERTDEDIAAGVIRLDLGGQAYVLPTLPWAASDEWQATLKAKLIEISGRDLDDLESAVAALSTTMDSLVDLIAAYDREHKLGRDATELRNRFDRAQLYETFKAIARHEFPFMRDAEGTVSMLMPYLRPILIALLSGVASRQQSGTSGRSPTGGSTPGLSVVDSTGGSSTPSGELGKSA